MSLPRLGRGRGRSGPTRLRGCARRKAGAPGGLRPDPSAGHDGAKSSVSITFVDLVEHAQVCRPVVAAAAGIMMLELFRGPGADRRRNFDQLVPGCLKSELDVG